MDSQLNDAKNQSENAWKEANIQADNTLESLIRLEKDLKEINDKKKKSVCLCS